MTDISTKLPLANLKITTVIKKITKKRQENRIHGDVKTKVQLNEIKEKPHVNYYYLVQYTIYVVH